MIRTRAIRSGFTVVELLTVVTILAILALIAIPLIPDHTEHKADLDGSCVCSVIRLAQVMSLSRQVEYEVVFDMKTGIVTAAKTGIEEEATTEVKVVALASPLDLKAVVPEEKTPSVETIYTYMLRAGTMIDVDFGGIGTLEFNDKGVPVKGGYVVISYEDYEQTLVVSEVTGCVTIKEIWK